MYTSLLYAMVRLETSYWAAVEKYLPPEPQDRVLEIGCSRGNMVRRFQKVAPASYGIDVNKEAILHGVTPNLAAMDATSLEFPSNSFDKIYSAHTIEHIPNLQKALQEMARVLRQGGKALLIYPAEPVRGIFALFSALLLWKNPRDIHVHKLSPKILEAEFLSPDLRVRGSKLTLFPRPEFYTIVEKT